MTELLIIIYLSSKNLKLLLQNDMTLTWYNNKITFFLLLLLFFLSLSI